MFIIDFQGQLCVVIVCLTSSWLAPFMSDLTAALTPPPNGMAPNWRHPCMFFFFFFLAWKWICQSQMLNNANYFSILSWSVVSPSGSLETNKDRYSQASWPSMFMSEIIHVFVGLHSWASNWPWLINHRGTSLTKNLIQTAKRNEILGMDPVYSRGLKAGFGRVKWFLGKPQFL